ncbi:hypothetical protein BKA70DRAFT_1243209 [Coprinopsis sp. MPI-PUGE-AT-0042]|nr:hypothetical protein BKA70DRAFT_1243209 [Coprinopsis sp. MPI-PUGE-AT-0042]
MAINVKDRHLKLRSLRTVKAMRVPSSEQGNPLTHLSLSAISIWIKEPQVWGPRFRSLGPFMADVTHWFDSIQPLTLEQARDRIRERMTAAHPDLFPQGQKLTSMEHLLGKLFSNLEVARYGTAVLDRPIPSLISFAQYPRRSEVVDRQMQLDSKISIHAGAHQKVQLSLRGLIYLGDAHFSSRIIDPEGRIWHHDGATTGRIYNRRSMENLWDSRGKKLSYAVYALSQ